MSKLVAIIIAVGALATSLVGCGKVKDRDDKVVRVEGGASAPSTVESVKLSGDLLAIQQFIQLYFEGDTISREGLGVVFERFKDKLGPILAGSKMSMGELIELLFKFDANRDGKLGVGELANGIFDRIPILRWIPSNAATITGEELAGHLMTEYPGASTEARSGLQGALVRFDREWTGGNHDGKLSRKELATAGLILSVMQQVDFTKPVELGGDASAGDKLAVEQLKIKLNQQIYDRQHAIDYTQLPLDDQKLEWMQQSLRFYLVDKLVHAFSPEGRVPAASQNAAIKAFGFPADEHWATIRKIYDNKMFGGDGDTNLNSIEMFMVLSELNYASKIWTSLGGNISAAGVDASPAKKRLVSSLMKVYPTAGQGMFMGSLADYKRDPWSIRKEFWDSIRAYDTKELGGNEDGRIDGEEFAVLLAVMRAVDVMYATYDVDGDKLLTKREVAPLIKELGFEDPRVVDAFFADVGLDGGKVSFWTKLKKFFSGATDIDRLLPYDFYVRIVKLFPMALEGKRP